MKIMAVLKPKEMAERLGVTVRTLQEWDRKGIFPAHRTPMNLRKYKHKISEDKELTNK